MASITLSMQLRSLPVVSKSVLKVAPVLSSCFILIHHPHTPESAWEPALCHLSCWAFPSPRTLCFAYLLPTVNLGPTPSLHTHPWRDQLLLMNTLPSSYLLSLSPPINVFPEVNTTWNCLLLTCQLLFLPPLDCKIWMPFLFSKIFKVNEGSLFWSLWQVYRKVTQADVNHNSHLHGLNKILFQPLFFLLPPYLHWPSKSKIPTTLEIFANISIFRIAQEQFFNLRCIFSTLAE